MARTERSAFRQTVVGPPLPHCPSLLTPLLRQPPSASCLHTPWARVKSSFHVPSTPGTRVKLPQSSPGLGSNASLEQMCKCLQLSQQAAGSEIPTSSLPQKTSVSLSGFLGIPGSVGVFLSQQAGGPSQHSIRLAPLPLSSGDCWTRLAPLSWKALYESS